MKLQAITVAAFLAVASTDVVDAKQGGVRRKTTKEENTAHKKKTAHKNKHHNTAHAKSKAATSTTAKRELGNKKKSDKCDVPIFPTDCGDGDGDLQPMWVGVKGEVCLSMGNSLCRKKHNWQFGVTAPMPMMGPGGMMPGMGMDPIPGPESWGPLPVNPNYYPGQGGTGCDKKWGCKMPDLSQVMPQSEPVNGGGNMAGMGGGDRKLGKNKKKWDKKPMPSGPYWGYGTPMVLPTPMMPPAVNLPEPPLPYNATDASAHLWRGPDCDPVWSFPHPATDVCVGMVGKDDFTNSTFAASSYLTFKNSTLPGAANPDGSGTDLDGDYWAIFHPLVGGDWKTMPRLKLDPSIDDGIVMKFKRGPDGKDNEDLLMAIDKDGDVFFNPYGQVFFAPGGDRTMAFMVDVSVAFPPTMMMTEEMMKKYGLLMMPGAGYSF